MTATSALPALFISHGSPTFALNPGVAGATLRSLGRHLPRPDAILVLSPHWMTPGLRLTASRRPQTIHDFGGFPAPLYQMQYPAPGSPELVAQVQQLLSANGLEAKADDSWGFDHGAWVPLRHLYPDADIPVVQISLPRQYGTLECWALGRALAPLRQRNVLLIGAGSITHNLYEKSHAAPQPYVSEFTDWVEQQIGDGALEALLDYRNRSAAGVRAHPSEEHLLPLYFAIGAAGEQWTTHQRLCGQIDYSVLSMDSWILGGKDYPLAA